MLREEVHMVGDNHHVANIEFRIHTTRSIRNEESLDAQFVHHTLRESNLLHAVALIVVEATLHSHDILATELTEDELSGMTFNCRYREVRNFRIWEFVGISYLGS